jgi:1-acyl-sn-glycerol-3-phosphate acyltransferase
MTRAQGSRINPIRGGSGLREPSPRALGLFSIYLRWYLRRHFHALRVANAKRIPVLAEPLVLFANHASWWDPLTAMIMGRTLLPERQHYAPMDAKALRHYSVFQSMGFFPVDNGSPRGAAQLLRTGHEILSRPGAVLWITPESQFQDVRKRPVTFKPGLGALMSRMGRMTCLPVAIEYVYWNERLPEILINIGEPLEIGDGTMEDARTWTNLLSYSMAATLDELTLLAVDRDPAAFETILSGNEGIGGVYEMWKRLLSVVTGKPYYRDHGSLHR